MSAAATAEKPYLIVGGGLAGVTSFYALAARGRPVVLLDAETEVAAGASHANGAVLHPSLPDPWNNPGIGGPLVASVFNPNAAMRLHVSQIPGLLSWGLSFLRHAAPRRYGASTRANFALADYSTRQTEALQQLLNLSFETAAPGTLKLFRNADDKAKSVALAELLRPQGLRYELLDQAALLAREPLLNAGPETPAGALYFPDDRVGDAHLFCLQLRDAAVARGGKVRLNTRVQALRREGGRVVGVVLQDGTRFDGEVVLCAGAAAPHLAAAAGIKLPVRPAKGYSVTVPVEGKPVQHPMVDPTVHIAVTPLRGRVRLLGMAEFAGFDRRIEPRRVAMLRRFFERLMPQAADTMAWDDATPWTGLRPMSADGRPFVGVAGDGLWVNCGHGHLGWTMAVGSALVLADLIDGREPEIDPAPFALGKARRAPAA